MSTAEEAARKAEQAQERADRLATQADQMWEHANGMYGRFAGGQPLLRGHHSYRSAVRDRRRADKASDRAMDVHRQAQQAQEEVRWAQAKVREAKAEEDIAAIVNARSRPWCRDDFQAGDIVKVRTFHTSTEYYRVKRVNAKTLTLDGGGGGMDDPKREYDRVLSRTRDGITITSPK
jgi:streptogramin lyase